MIKLSRMADYGVVLMSHMARDPKSLKTASDLSSECALPLPTVSKVLKLLTQGRLLVSHRGTKGGYCLAFDPVRITMADIIGAMDGPIALTDCMTDSGADCDIQALCPTRTNWRRINEAIKAALTGITLDEMSTPATMFLKPEFEGLRGAGPAAGAAE